MSLLSGWEGWHYTHLCHWPLPCHTAWAAGHKPSLPGMCLGGSVFYPSGCNTIYWVGFGNNYIRRKRPTCVKFVFPSRLHILRSQLICSAKHGCQSPSEERSKYAICWQGMIWHLLDVLSGINSWYPMTNPLFNGFVGPKWWWKDEYIIQEVTNMLGGLVKPVQKCTRAILSV